MSLSAAGLACEIVNSICSTVNNDNMVAVTTPELGQAISRYLTRNTQVKYTWSGRTPGSYPTSDPVTNYITTRVVGSFTCSPTNTLNPERHGIILGRQITDGIRRFRIFPAEGWTISPSMFLCAPNIVLPPFSTLDAFQYWLFQAGVILRFYKRYINPTPLTGAHGPFLAPPGSGAVMSQIF